MAIRLPEYQESVGLVNPGAPSVPSLSAPPPSAFGTESASELKQTGGIVAEAGSQLAEHILQRQEMAQRAQVLQKNTQFYQELQNGMMSTEPIERTDPQTGEKSTVPAGFFARHGTQAEGATRDFDVYYQNKRADALSDPHMSVFQKTLLDERISNDYPRYREKVAQHEAEQTRAGINAITDGAVNQEIENAGNWSNDPEALADHIKHATQIRHDNDLANGLDDQKGELSKRQQEIRNSMADNAIKPLIDANPQPALNFLDDLNKTGEISSATYQDQKTKIINGARQKAELNKFFLEQGQDEEMRKTLLESLDGGVSPSEVDRRYQQGQYKKGDYENLKTLTNKPDYQLSHFSTEANPLTQTDPASYNEIRDAQLSRANTPGQLSRMILEAAASGKISAVDAKYLDKKTVGMAPDPRDRDIQAQANYVRDFANRFINPNGGLIDTYFQGGKSAKAEKDKDVEDLVRQYTDQVDKQNASGDDLQKIAQQTVMAAGIKRFPELGKVPLEQWPDIVQDIDGKIYHLFNPGTSKGKGQKVTIPKENQE